MDHKTIVNTSGLEPQGQAVLCMPYTPEIKASPIIIPEESIRRMETLDARVIVIAIGPDAWGGSTPRAKVGDKVLVSAYCGSMLRGPADDKQYRMVNGRDIYGTITSERDTGSVESKMDRRAVSMSNEE